MDSTVRGRSNWLVLAMVVVAGLLVPTAASAMTLRVPERTSSRAKRAPLTLSRPAAATAGGLATFTGAYTYGAKVALQRRTSSGWQTVASGTAGKAGHFALTWIAPSKATRVTVRAVALVRGRAGVVSKSRRLIVRRAEGKVITVSPKTTVLSQATVVSAPAPGASGKLTYSGGNAVSVGAIIAIAPGAADPDGFLGRVTSVQTSKGNSVAQTVPATLEEAIPNGSFNRSLSNFTVNTARLRQDLERAATESASCQGGATASVDAHASMGLSVNLASSWSLLHGLESATFTGNANANASITATVTGSGSCTLNPYQLVRISGPSDLFWLGPVPVYLSSKILIDVKGSAFIKANASAGMSGGLIAEAGLKWDHGNISAIHQFTHTLKTSAPTASASGDVTATLLPTIQLSVDGGGHADLNLSAGVDFHADATANPWWTITAPVAITGDLNISKLHISSPTINIWSHTFTLATASGEFGTGTGGPGTGGTGTTPTTDALSIGNPGTQTTTVNTSVDLAVSAVSSSGATITYSTSTLPPGLSLNTSTGVIMGSPTTTGSYTVTVNVSDTTGAAASTTFTWVVSTRGVNVTVQNPGTQSWHLQNATTLTLSASDTTPGATLTYGASGLPAGLSLDTSTGVISGTPTTPGSGTATVTASDQDNSEGSTSFSWTVSNYPTATPSPGPPWTLAVPSSGITSVVPQSPSGDLLVNCALVTPAGTNPWTITTTNAANCTQAIADQQNTWYVSTMISSSPTVEALNSSGSLLWTQPLTNSAFAGDSEGPLPSLTSTGTLYMPDYLDPEWDLATFNASSGQPGTAINVGPNTFAYYGGIADLNGTLTTTYLNSSGTVTNSYTASGIDTNDTTAFAPGADGDTFWAGYQSGTGDIVLDEMTPAGPGWSWTGAPSQTVSSGTIKRLALTATPNGGVLITQSYGGEPEDVNYTEIGAGGHQLWTYTPTGPAGTIFTSEYETPIADANGVVVLPYSYETTCSDQSQSCSGFTAEFVNQNTGATVFSAVNWNPGNNDSTYGSWGDDAVASSPGVFYVEQGLTSGVNVFASAVPGLAINYQTALQEQAQTGSS